jgi:hypothetical protein
MTARPLVTEEGVLTPFGEQVRDRARRDFRFFATNFLKIKPKSELLAGQEYAPIVPFRFNRPQQIVLKVMYEMLEAGLPVEIVILKARQFGISTLFCAWLYWIMWRMMHVGAAVVAQKKKTLRELNETMNTFYTYMPDGMKPRLLAGNASRVSQEMMYFDDRKSECWFVTQEPDAMRGPARHAVLTTEVGSYRNADEFYGSFLPTMSPSPFKTLIFESSAADGYLRDIYTEAKSESSPRRAIFLPWFIYPELYSREIERRGKAWYDKLTGAKVTFANEERREQAFCTKVNEKVFGLPPVTDAQMWWRRVEIETKYQGDEEYFNQEFPRDDESCFERATYSAFKAALPEARRTSEEAEEKYEPRMGILRSSTYTNPSLTQIVSFEDERKSGWIDQVHRPGLLLIAEPEPGKTYTIGADVAADNEAREDEDDESAYSVACVYCCDTREQVAEWRGNIDPYDFGNEIVKLGYYFNTGMICIERNNMGQVTEHNIISDLHYPNLFRWPDMNAGGNKLTKKWMWETNSRTKMLMMSELKRWIRDGLFIVRSTGLASELSTYQIRNDRYECAAGTHSDRIIAACLCVQAVAQTGYGMALVLGSAGPSPTEAQGAAARYVKPKGLPRPVPSQLPDGFDDGTPLQIDRSYWEAATL